jgi:hypothetical protein
MATMTTGHPKKSKYCVFCTRWSGDAKLTPENSTVGFRFDATVFGMCAKNNIKKTAATNASTCKEYSPNEKARMFL